MGSIPGAAIVLLFFASPTVLGGTIIKMDLFLRLSRHRTCKFGRLQRLARKDSPKKLCIRVDSNPRSLDNGADAIHSEPPWQRFFRQKNQVIILISNHKIRTAFFTTFFKFLIEQVLNFTPP